MEAILTREVLVNKTLCRLFGVCAFVILMSLGAFVRIPLPFTPVPITLQTFFVLLSGALMGANLATATQLSYVFLGVLGLPIFTGAGSGILYLAGPTAGYLFGFILAAIFAGKLIKYSKNNFFSAFLILYFADLILLISGVAWLKIIFGYPLHKLLFIGFLPFLAADSLKAVLAAFIYLKLQPRLKNIF